jgi:hypothetical protein
MADSLLLEEVTSPRKREFDFRIVPTVFVVHCINS